MLVFGRDCDEFGRSAETALEAWLIYPQIDFERRLLSADQSQPETGTYAESRS